MGFSIFLQNNVTIKILVFTLKLKDRKTENYKTASGHHKVEHEYDHAERSLFHEFRPSQNRKRSSQGRGLGESYIKLSISGHKTASGHHKVESVYAAFRSWPIYRHKTASGHHKVEVFTS